MSDAQTVGRAFMLMVCLIVFGALLAYAVGMAHDVVVTSLIEHGIDAGEGTPWNSTRELNILTALLYFICSLPPVLGILIFGISVTKRTRRDAYYESGETYYQEE